MHQSSYEHMRRFRELYLQGCNESRLKILDLGSLDVNGSYRPLFECMNWSYTGVDLTAGKNVDHVINFPYDWSGIPSSSVDVCISGQALEHMPYFWLVMLEVERVLKPGGLCCVIAPSGGYEHRYPVDCWRFYPDGFFALSEFSGLKVKEIYTDWHPDPSVYSDDSAAWKDSVLIAEKPRLSRIRRFRRSIRSKLLRYLSVG